MSLQISERARKWLDRPLFILSVIMVIYQLYYVLRPMYTTSQHRIVHLAFVLLILILTRMRKKGGFWPFYALLIVLSLGVSFVYLSYFNELASVPAYFITPVLISGVITLLLVTLTSYWGFGATFLVMTGIFVGYMLIGPYVPGPLASPSIPWKQIIMWLAADVTVDWGTYGSTLGISANYLFLFVVFGTFLSMFGGMRFITQVGYLVASRLTSGPGALCVTTSALIGTVVGSTVTNIAISGAITIPLMKKVGYSPEQAAGIEACASTGGQMLPPVMGTIAFLMVAFTGITYAEICKAAAIPAVIYYFAIFLYVQFMAKKMGIASMPFKVDYKQFLLDMPSFVIPLTTLIVLLVLGFSSMKVIFWTIIVTFGIGLLGWLLRKEIRPKSFKEVEQSISDGVHSACGIAVLCALLGVLDASMSTTGLGVKLGDVLVEFARGNVFLLLLMTMIFATILGMGVPGTVSYVLVAIILAPSLVELGVPMIAAHLFVLFYACWAAITLPVALGILVAHKIAGSDYWRTGWECIKIAYGSYMLPFFFVYAPAVIMRFSGFYESVIQMMAVLLFITNFTIAANNMFLTEVRPFERILFAIGGALPVISLISPAWYFLTLIALGITALATLMNYQQRRRERPAVQLVV